jgi:hypothetical protein
VYPLLVVNYLFALTALLLNGEWALIVIIVQKEE